LHDKVSGTTDWSSHEISFVSKENQRADLVKLNLSFAGRGTA
jgi:hypothetical protein